MIPYVLLLFVLPVLTASISVNDPFHAIAIRVPPKSSPPVCCLVPLPPTDPVEPDILLSFEEWKEKQNANPSLHNHVSIEPVSVSIPVDEPTSVQELGAPHFRVPVTDRFNYAGLDCSARVHLAHKSAKSPSSILSSKRDRYMLSPCNSPNEKQFVIVELCDDIRIDTVQLANFEFFSGVFKDFTVSVAKTYTTNEEGWTVAGTYRAKNVRGVQTWHPPTSLRDFYRFIRIDFHSHYSNEYYCPISLLRVYGLTHLEEWKWEMWEAESRAKRDGVPELPLEQASPAEAPTVSMPVTAASTESITHPPALETLETEETSIVVSDANATQDAISSSTSTSFSSSTITTSSTTINENNASTNERTTSTPDAFSSTSSATIISTNEDQSASSISSSTSSSTSSVVSANSTTFSSSTSSSQSINATSTVIASPHSSPSSSAGGGESIYRTINNRLTALESNHTLYTLYVQDQTTHILDLLRRLTEDLGRLDGVGKAQNQRFTKMVGEWEEKRRTLESEYWVLKEKVEVLVDEVTLEKRLSIAQLCLLTAVLVFMGLTRGSTAHDHHRPLHSVKLPSGLRKWSGRHLSLSGDWDNWFLRRASLSSNPSTEREKTIKGDPDLAPKFEFPPSSAAKTPSRNPRMTVKTPQRSSSRPRTPPSRTPTSRHFPNHHHHHHRGSPLPPLQISSPTPSSSTRSARPRLKRANSHGNVFAAAATTSMTSASSSSNWNGLVPPRSAGRRLARSAHLHEVKSPLRERRLQVAAATAAVPTLPEVESKTGEGGGGHAHAQSLPTLDFDPVGLGIDIGKRVEEPPLHSSSSEPNSIIQTVAMSPQSEREDTDVWIDTDASFDGFEDEDER